MGFEPLPNIQDGILVERLVKTMRHIADMRRCQYVVQRPEGVRRRQPLNVEYVDRSNPPKSENAQGLSTEIGAHGLLPAAGSD
jgi:hypothetical protein